MNRCDEIELMIAKNEMTAAQVYTQMLQLIPKQAHGVYYKVYQDIEMDSGYYVDTLDGVLRTINHWREGVAEHDEVKWPVFEPVEMTETEFKSLPEFTGY